MKKVLFSLAVVACIGLVSCDGNKANEENAEGEAQEIVVDEVETTPEAAPEATNDSPAAENTEATPEATQEATAEATQQ